MATEAREKESLKSHLKTSSEMEFRRWFIGLFLSAVGLLFITGCGVQNVKHTKASQKKLTATLTKETTHLILPFKGELPLWLKGTFVRNGPISAEINHEKIHWFDGPAMLHAFTFQNGKIYYTNKFLKSDVYHKIFDEKSFDYPGFTTTKKQSLFSKIVSFIFPPSKTPIRNANVNVDKVAHQYIALTEIPLPVQFNLNTLDTLGPLKFQDNLPKRNVFESAHIQTDGETQEKFNYIVDYGFKTHYIVYRLNAKTPCREIIGKLPVKRPAYMHSFALTKNYIILVEFPLLVNPLDLMFSTNKGFIENYRWCPEQGTNFIIMSRSTGKVVKTLPHPQPFFAFHHVNAFEVGNTIALDILTYPDAKIIPAVGRLGDATIFHGGENTALADIAKTTQLMRYTVNLDADTIDSTVLMQAPIEFPRINEQYAAHPHRYVYLADPRPLSKLNESRTIYKFDTHTHQKITWKAAGVLPGEPVFIPHPNKSAEDEGVIVTIVLEPVKQKAFLLLLDAKTMSEIGRSYVPYPIPLGLHGRFF